MGCAWRWCSLRLRGLIFGLAGASVAAPAVVPSNTTPAATTVQMPDDQDIERCRDHKARIDDADL